MTDSRTAITAQPSLFDGEPVPPLAYVGPVLIGVNDIALCMRCTDSSIEGDDPRAWANWHARQNCHNYTGFRAS